MVQKNIISSYVHKLLSGVVSMFHLIIRKIRLIKHSLHYTGWICNNNDNNNNNIFEFCKKGSQEWYGQAHYITLDGSAIVGRSLSSPLWSQLQYNPIQFDFVGQQLVCYCDAVEEAALH